MDLRTSLRHLLVISALLSAMVSHADGQIAGDHIEDFETGDFNKFPLENSGDASWVVTSLERHSGTYGAQAGSINDDEETTLQVTLDCVSGNITFYRKVSSESGFDYLTFYINGMEEGEWSGEEDWGEASFPVTAGTRTFQWTYSKDGSESTGYDTAWIDDIVFPIQGQRTESALAYEGTDGCLVYETYANEGQTNSVNTLPDFSHCGYMGGGVAIPDVPVAIHGRAAMILSARNGDDTDESHPWDAIVLEDVEDCWVRRVTAQFFAFCCVKVESESTRVTIEDCAFLDPKSIITGSRRYAFVINSRANHILFQRCYAHSARHSFATGSRVPGPNVFVDCYADDCRADSGPHHRWAVGTLFDNVYDSREIAAQNRRHSGTGHGWAGAQQVLWNCQAGSIICEAPNGAMNFSIGCSGTRRDGRWIDAPDGWCEHHGRPVSPRSLYYKQLEDRLGMAAVENVTTPEQRSGDIWPGLAAWGKHLRRD